jgi:hypothetical protein
MASFGSHWDKDGRGWLRGSMEDRTIIVICVLAAIVVLALAGVLSGENVTKILPALLK